MQARDDSRMIRLVRSSSAVRCSTALSALLVLLLAGVVGCAGETGIVVSVTSPDLVAPGDVDTLRFEAMGAAGVMAHGDFPISGRWPHSLAIRPRAGDDSGAVTVRIAGLKGGVEVATTTVSSAFRSGETVNVTATLSGCVGSGCLLPDGGMSDLGVDLGEEDLGVDAGDLDAGVDDLGTDEMGVTDLGMSDLGVTDLGVDMGPRDLGPIDLGTDLGPTDMGFVGSLLGALVISELAVGSMATGTDEFVELYNRTATPIDVGGVVVEYASSAGTSYSARATVSPGVVIPAHSYYLLGSVDYFGTVVPDEPMAWIGTRGFAGAGGHVRIIRGAEVIDLIGWRTAAAPEGTAVTGPSGNDPGSYERKADGASTIASMSVGGADVARGNSRDTNDNAADFIYRVTRDPQNADSPPEMP